MERLSLRHLAPSWKINLLVIGGLIGVVLCSAMLQVGQLRKNFDKYALMHARVVSGVIEQNTKTAILAENALRQTIKTFLTNTARFIEYLDEVESFSASELEAFAGETGLAGILIEKVDGRRVAAGHPALDRRDCRRTMSELVYLPEGQLYVMSWPRPAGGCIVLAFSAPHIETLHGQLRMPALLEALSSLPGIRYVTAAKDEIQADANIVEQRIRAGGSELRVGFDTAMYTMRVQQIWRNVVVFTIVLSCLGLFSSWLLYRYQKIYLGRITEYERRLAQEREDAALGRATATITHEIRNPLNAISMGLQRIEIEAEELSPEHRELASTMRQAVKRTDAIIGDLLRYARPITIAPKQLDLNELLAAILRLYRPQCEQSNITLQQFSSLRRDIAGDSEQLSRLFENIVKNGVEAQPEGGWLTLAVDEQAMMARVVVENGCRTTPAVDGEQLLEPYFTTKTRGTGLGLPIARRIAQAHGGTLAVEMENPGIFRTVVYLPLAGEGATVKAGSSAGMKVLDRSVGKTPSEIGRVGHENSDCR